MMPRQTLRVVGMASILALALAASATAQAPLT
jgi:hypothetical protein